MRTDLRDFTFIILIRLDTIERLENIIAVTRQLYKLFDTSIFVLEVDSYNNGLLKKNLNRKIQYSFIQDKDPVLYKTKYINELARQVNTPYLAIWDADIVPDKYAVIDAVENLRKDADMSLPYNGKCYDVPVILREYYLIKNDIRILYRNRSKMKLLHDRALVGGAVFVRKDKYIYCGMENEKHYGWGNDDFDRYYRFLNLRMNIYRANYNLYHLSHPRKENSFYRSDMHIRNSDGERFKTESSSGKELQMRI